MKRLILIIEDDEDLRNVLILYLESHDYLIIDSQDLFGNDLKQMPDLILMDNKLPGSIGKDNCSILKQNKYTEHIPVIMMSGSPIKEESIAAGAAAFVAKPFDLDDLLDTIRKNLPY